MDIIIAPDSFKGSADAMSVAKAMQRGAQRVFPDANFLLLPMADGGEGTLAIMMESLGGKYYQVLVENPLQDTIKANFGILPDGSAVIEMASASGLTLIKNNNIMRASTYGTGQLIKAALDMGCTTIYLGIGGSATNDGGVGMAQALGISFLDRDKHEIGRGAQSLMKIHTINGSKMDPRIKKTKFIIMSDVTNPLCGEQGASYVYGPQKGATKEELPLLDNALFHLAECCTKTFAKDYRSFPGSGAAGGLGFGLLTFCNGTLCSGIDVLLQVSHFKEKQKDYDLILTGEGRIDQQTCYGKVPCGIAKAAKDANIPVIAIGGCFTKDAVHIVNHGVSGWESCIYEPCSQSKAMKNAIVNIEDASERALRMVQIGLQLHKQKGDCVL